MRVYLNKKIFILLDERFFSGLPTTRSFSFNRKRAILRCEAGRILKIFRSRTSIRSELSDGCDCVFIALLFVFVEAS